MTNDAIRELRETGYCVLKHHLASPMIEACRNGFWPLLLAYVEGNRGEPNRGTHRHCVPMPFEPPCFHPGFFFDGKVLKIVQETMDDRVVADQWHCDAPLSGSNHQGIHVDYKRPLFAELPDLQLPVYMLIVSFSLNDISLDHGPIEVAPGTHRLPRAEALRAVQTSEIEMRPIPMGVGDVLIRHPWMLHRGSPNRTDTPRALVSIRWVRRWYVDDSREVAPIPLAVWETLTLRQQSMMRFPITDR